MPDNKILKIFHSLSGVEKRVCTKWLESPYFNQRMDTTRLWHWLLGQKPSQIQSRWDGQKTFEELFPEEEYQDSKWRHLQSQLSLLIEKFLAQRELEKRPVDLDLKLIPALRQKKLTQSASGVFRRVEERLSKLPVDIDYLHSKYQLEWEKFATIETTERIGKNNLAELGLSLDIYLIASKLRLACMMQAHRAVYQIEYDDSFLPAILDYVEKNSLMEIPAIALYYHCYQAINSGTESDFLALRNELEKKQAGIPIKERRPYLLMAINYCIKQLNTGEERYVREALDLYRTGLETETLLADGQLSRFAYKNIVALGLKLEEYDWVKNFIEEYVIYLEEDYRESNRNYNMARLHFTKNEFQKAMPMLAKIDDKDLLLNLDSKVMLLKMYYETREIDALESLLSSFRIQLLRKKKIIGYHQQHYLNMVRYIKKMIRLNQFEKDKVEALRQEVLNNNSVIEKDWILTRIGLK